MYVYININNYCVVIACDAVVDSTLVLYYECVLCSLFFPNIKH